MKILSLLFTVLAFMSCNYNPEKGLLDEDNRDLSNIDNFYPDNRVRSIDGIDIKIGEVALTHRIKYGCENQSCYFDLYNMVQNYGYGLPIGFGNDHGTNMLDTEMVVDEHGDIVSLGKGSCKLIENENNPYNRNEDPESWLYYSNHWDKLRAEGVAAISIQEDHCYLMHKRSSNNEIVAMFHIKKLSSKRFIIIDEVETLLKRGEAY